MEQKKPLDDVPSASDARMDPLIVLPAEIVLRILHFAPVVDTTRLTCLNKTWRYFIDGTHQDTIYGPKARRPSTARDLSFLPSLQSFAQYFDGTSSWKELCKRQTLLWRNWNSEEPITRESIIQVGNDAIWRFRPDLKRRFILSTSQQGGLNVTDMDTGASLWRLSNDEVRPFAHLEYQDGIAAWDREGDAIEIWRTGIADLPRGAFQRIAILSHDYQTRGFQLSYNTLCVVSTQGRSFVYDMNQQPPSLTTEIIIEANAAGHVDQNEDLIMICMGKRGYHFYDKVSGNRVGDINPMQSNRTHHIRHPPRERTNIISTGSAFDALPSIDIFPPRRPRKDRLKPLEIADGPIPRSAGEHYVSIDDDEWGAALLSGPLMVGISRAGRVLICVDWRLCVQQPEKMKTLSYVIECESDGSSFDLGGWLSIRDNRIMFEIQDRVYVLALTIDGGIARPRSSGYRPSFTFITSSATQLTVPVSFMVLCDDCIMTTYTTLGWRRRTHEVLDQPPHRFRIFPTKTIRILSFAPSLESDKEEDENVDAHATSALEEERNASIMEIMDMLSEDEDEFETDDET